MASGNEHRMVFDIRGKRRHVVKAVYAVLAVLMGASLFLVVGPVNIGSLLGNNASSSSNRATEYEEKATRAEVELKKNPGDEELLARATKNRMLAGQQSYTAGPNGEAVPTIETRTQYQKASSAWSEYLKASSEPNAILAQQMGGTLFALAQLSRTYPEAAANLEAAAEAQKIAAEKQPTLNSLSTQAIYTAFAGDYKEAEEANEAAEAKATSKFQREQVGNQFDAAKKSAVKFQKELNESVKAFKEATAREAAEGGNEGSGSEVLQNPLGSSLGGAGLAE